jgi:hypothetical protein
VYEDVLQRMFRAGEAVNMLMMIERRVVCGMPGYHQPDVSVAVEFRLTAALVMVGWVVLRPHPMTVQPSDRAPSDRISSLCSIATPKSHVVLQGS